MNRLIKTILLIFLVFSFSSINLGCKKYLDKKSNQRLVVPTTVGDLQALLEFYLRINQYDPASEEISADNFYLDDNDYDAVTVENDRRRYTWEKDNLFPPGFNEWSYAYDNIYRANVVLNSIDNIGRTTNDQIEWSSTKGSAYFFRAKFFLQIASIWAVAYDQSTASTDLGIPLRLDPNFNIPSTRASLQNTYDVIISDLKSSIQLLPVTSTHVMRPSKPTAYALLARTYLSMRQYDKAGLYADSCLQLKNILMDYNNDPNIIPSNYYPFKRFNPEALSSFYANFTESLYYGRIDSNLYNSYSTNDLRKKLYFNDNGNGTFGFRGSYEPDGLFTGISTDEVYLIRAECFARAGNVTSAINDLNALLIKRWKTGTFIPFSAADANIALDIILIERRKELLFRCLRWMDIKRLNKEGRNITLKRVIKGQTYVLAPNDKRYALPFPEDVITISGMTQNPR